MKLFLKSGSSYSISIYSLKTEQQMNWSNAHISIKKISYFTMLLLYYVEHAPRNPPKGLVGFRGGEGA